MPFNGDLVRNKVHSHMTSFYKMILVAGDVSRVLDKTYETDKPWDMQGVRDHGYNSSKSMFADLYNKIASDKELQRLKQAETLLL